MRAERQQRAALVERLGVERRLAGRVDERRPREPARRAPARSPACPRRSRPSPSPSRSAAAGGRRGAAHASGLVPSRRSRPPNGATVGSALQNASATSPSLGQRLDVLAEPADVVAAADRDRADPVVAGEPGELDDGEPRGELPEPAAAVDDRDRAVAPGELGLRGRVDVAVADELQVRDEPPDAVRVVPAQVRLDQRFRDRACGSGRRPGVLEDRAGELTSSSALCLSPSLSM